MKKQLLLFASVLLMLPFSIGCSSSEESKSSFSKLNLVQYDDGSCAYSCSWGEGDCVWNLGGEIVSGSCGGGQACCYTGEPARPKCQGTCIMQWESCSAGTVKTDSNCSDLQKVCCQGSSPDTGSPDTGSPDTGSPDTGSPDTGSPDTGSPDTGSPDTGSPDTGSPDTGVENGTASVSLSSDWNSGYCADVTVGGLSNWTVVLNVGQSVITNLWNGNHTASGSTVTVTGTHSSFGFCANKTGTNYRPVIVSVNGTEVSQPDTGSPDTGSPDTGSPDTGSPDTGSPDTGSPDTGGIDLSPGNTQGYATRYWDCCKPHCAWSGNVPGTPVQTCDINNNSNGNNWDMRSSCDGGDAFTCYSMAPWAVNNRLSYGFSAVPATGDVCGKCYQVNFTGSGRYGYDEGSSALSSQSKVMIVQAMNIGYDVSGGQFDLLIPGGGVGAFDACSRQWNAHGNLGAQYGGFLTACQGAGSHQAKKDCVLDRCRQVFNQPNMGDLMAGCQWFVDWFEAADNPNLLYKEVPCPQELINVSGMRR